MRLHYCCLEFVVCTLLVENVSPISLSSHQFNGTGFAFEIPLKGDKHFSDGMGQWEAQHRQLTMAPLNCLCQLTTAKLLQDNSTHPICCGDNLPQTARGRIRQASESVGIMQSDSSSPEFLIFTHTHTIHGFWAVWR